MSGARNAALQIVSGSPPPARGRLLSVDDVLALLPKRADGRTVQSRWWVTHRFCPAGKRKLGRNPVWFEGEALAWIASQTATGEEG